MTHTPKASQFRAGLFRVAVPLVWAAVLGASACRSSVTEEGESGTRYASAETATEVRKGIELIARYDSSRRAFTGEVRNTTNATVRQVRVEIHLSNGAELGPTPRVDLAAGQHDAIELDAGGHNFDWWTVHVEIGTDSG